MKKIYFYICLFTLNIFTVNAQNSNELTGKITNSNNEPITDAVVVMQTIDSVFVRAELTDSLGVFRFVQHPNSRIRLIVQHISYNPETVEIEPNVNDAGTIVLKENVQIISEARVIAESPLLTVDGSTLLYNAKLLSKDKPVSNAFDVVKETPGIVGSDNSIQLLGANRLNIIINGTITTMPAEQIYSLLKSIPASRVKTVEIMYNAPAKYNFRGSLINVVLISDDIKNFTGEISAGYKQSHYASGTANVNFLYTSKKLTLDFILNAATGKDWKKYNTFSRHRLADNIFAIDQQTRTTSQYDKLNLRFGADYAFRNENRLSFSYYASGGKSATNTFSNDYYEEAAIYNINSLNKNGSKNWLHNIHLQYSTKNAFSAGIDFTSYSAPENNHFTSNANAPANNDFLYNSTQNIYQWKIFASKKQNLTKKWTLEFGANGGLNNSNTHNEYLYPQSGYYVEDILKRADNHQKEYTGRFFVESAHKISPKLSATIGVEAEYFYSDYKQNMTSTILWNEWTFYPKTMINYMISPMHVMIFNISTNKNYPSYWAVNPQTTYIDSYMEITGNPALKPYNEYTGQFAYILNKKYVFIIWAIYMPDYFALIPHQDDNRLKTVYRYENYDFSLFLPISLIIPVTVTSWFNTRISIHGLRMQDKKMDFYNSPFNRKHYVGTIALNNTFIVSKKYPNLSLQINGRYQSRAIQGIYDVSDDFSLSAILKCTLKNQSYFTIQYGNILRREPHPLQIIDFGDQYSRRKNFQKDYIAFQIAWKIGDYKEKQYSKPNQSRFGKD